jgi:hypothetical protein
MKEYMLLVRNGGAGKVAFSPEQHLEFEYNTRASIEVRPVKMKEESTNFVYPKE